MRIGGGLRRLATAPRRLARSRGFGVHSPFAYSFIREVLRPGYRYYAYLQIERAAERYKVSEKLLKIAFRVAARFDYRSVSVGGPASEALTAVMRLLRRDMTINPGGVAQLVVSNGDAAKTRQNARKCVAEGGTVILADIHRPEMNRLWCELTSGRSGGMAFEASRIGILVASPHLPRQDFSLWL